MPHSRAARALVANTVSSSSRPLAAQNAERALLCLCVLVVAIPSAGTSQPQRHQDTKRPSLFHPRLRPYLGGKKKRTWLSGCPARLCASPRASACPGKRTASCSRHGAHSPAYGSSPASARAFMWPENRRYVVSKRGSLAKPRRHKEGHPVNPVRLCALARENRIQMARKRAPKRPHFHGLRVYEVLERLRFIPCTPTRAGPPLKTEGLPFGWFFA